MYYLSSTLPVLSQRNHGIIIHLFAIKGSLTAQLTSYHLLFFTLNKKIISTLTPTTINSPSK